MKKIIIILISAFLAADSFATLIISNSAATTLTTTSMYFNATVASTNGTGTNPTCVVFYGTVDYTTNSAYWAASNVYGLAGVGSISTQITGLSPAHKYYFAWHATEGANAAWATPSLSAWTKPIAPTSTPSVVTVSLQVYTNNTVAMTNFFIANSNLIISAIGLSGYLTEETLWNAASNSVVYTNSPDYQNLLTNTATKAQGALAEAAYPASNPSGYISSVESVAYGITNGSAYRGDWGDAVSNLASTAMQSLPLTNDLIGATNALNAAVSALGGQTTIISNDVESLKSKSNAWNAAATDSSAATNNIATNIIPRLISVEGQTNASITGATITAGSADTVQITGRNAAITWNTNAAGGGAATDTNAVRRTGDTMTGALTNTAGLRLGSGSNTLSGVGSFNIGTVVYGYQIATGVGAGNIGTVEGAEVGDALMQADGVGAMNAGMVYGADCRIYASGIGSMNRGYTEFGYIVTNNGNGSIGIADGSGSLVLTNHASIVLGNGQSKYDRSVLADYVTVRNGFEGNGAGLTNVNIPTTNALIAATNAINTVANAALPKTFTNTAAIVSLQVTGSSPTNGAVWIATNTAGQGKWSLPVAFRTLGCNSDQFCSNGIITQVYWRAEEYDYGDNFDLTSFVAPVKGEYSFTFKAHFYPQNGNNAEILIRVNGVDKAFSYLQTPVGQADINMPPAVLTTVLTNGAIVDCTMKTSGTNKLYYFGGAEYKTHFSGTLIRELP